MVFMKDEIEYDRVTSVLGPFSGLHSIDADVLSNAASRGTAVHNLCGFIAKNLGVCESDIDDAVNKYSRNPEHFEKEKVLVTKLVDSFKEWAVGKKFLTTPQRFFDPILKITGECDLIYKNEEGELTLVDLKTPVNESKTWNLQASAYEYLAKISNIQLQKLQFVKLSRTSKPAIEYTYQSDFGLFLSVLTTYRHFYKPWKSPVNEDYI